MRAFGFALGAIVAVSVAFDFLSSCVDIVAGCDLVIEFVWSEDL